MVVNSTDRRMAAGWNLCGLLFVVQSIRRLYRGLHTTDRTTGARTQTAAYVRPEPRSRKATVLMAASPRSGRAAVDPYANICNCLASVSSVVCYNVSIADKLHDCLNEHLRELCGH